MPLNRIIELKNNEGFMKYLKNTSWLFLEKIIRMFAGLFVGAWLARYLGTDKFGIYSYVISFVGLFQVLATLGLDNFVIKRLVTEPNKKDLLLGTAFALKLIGTFVMISVLLITINFTSNDLHTNILILIIASSAIFESFKVIDFYFQSKVLSKFIVYSNITSLIISSLIKVYLILTQAPLISFMYVFLIDSFVLALCYIFFFYKNNETLKSWRFKTKLAKQLILESWPLIISSMVVAIYMKIDQVMIKEMLGNSAVGQYGAAVKLSEIWFFIPVVISSSLFPAIINSKNKSIALYNDRLQNLYDLMIYIAVSITIPIVLASDFIVNILYGSQYTLTANILKIHIWSGLFVFLGVANSKWLINEKMQKYSMINTSIGAVVNIIGNYILINKMGVIGAAWSSLISYFIASYFCLALFNKTRPNFYRLSKSLLFISAFNKVKKIFNGK